MIKDVMVRLDGTSGDMSPGCSSTLCHPAYPGRAQRRPAPIKRPNRETLPRRRAKRCLSTSRNCIGPPSCAASMCSATRFPTPLCPWRVPPMPSWRSGRTADPTSPKADREPALRNRTSSLSGPRGAEGDCAIRPRRGGVERKPGVRPRGGRSSALSASGEKKFPSSRWKLSMQGKRTR